MKTSSNNFFWKEIIKWLKRFQVLLDPFVETSILFGILKYQHFKLINHIIIIGKQVYWKTSFEKNVLFALASKLNTGLVWYVFRLIFNFFYHISEVEINITQRRGVLDNCYIKWSNTVNWLPSRV